ncbi:hypothetical protein WP2_079 [Pseudomonas phage WP2]|nr:hypothetical protein [Pseudomonas phage Clover]WNV49189.1 hypothetical protein [Pseudomonas phage Chuck]
MNVWHFLGLWLLLSIVLAPLIGRCIHFGMNGPKEMEKRDAHIQ